MSCSRQKEEILCKKQFPGVARHYISSPQTCFEYCMGVLLSSLIALKASDVVDCPESTLNTLTAVGCWLLALQETENAKMCH
jgi:hypothetical protein